jgi:hypothetical protein
VENRRGPGTPDGGGDHYQGGVWMKIAFSPCPNDTFIFYAWVH